MATTETAVVVEGLRERVPLVVEEAALVVAVEGAAQVVEEAVALEAHLARDLAVATLVKVTERSLVQVRMEEKNLEALRQQAQKKDSNH